MATTNLSAYDSEKIPDCSEMTIGIVVSQWNQKITDKLLQGAHNTLLKLGVKNSNIIVTHVPGSFELPMGAQCLIKDKKIQAVICLGSIVKGETRHFDFICQAVSNGIMNVGLKHNTPVIFGVLTDNNTQQAIDRSGGKLGNKGDEAAVTAVKMIALQHGL